jgi:hypothetical protein
MASVGHPPEMSVGKGLHPQKTRGPADRRAASRVLMDFLLLDPQDGLALDDSGDFPITTPRYLCNGFLDVDIKTVFQNPDVFQNRFRRFGPPPSTSLSVSSGLSLLARSEYRFGPRWDALISRISPQSASDWPMEGLLILMHGILLMILQIIPQLDCSVESARIGAVVPTVP